MKKTKTYMPHLSAARDARAVRTRAALRNALLSLLETRPMDQVTIRDLASTAGIGYTTFFRHYPTKEALLNELAADEIRRLVDLTLPAMHAKPSRAGSEALFLYVHEHRALWSTFLTGGAAGVLREELLQIALGLAADRSRVTAWAPAELTTRLLVSGTIEVLSWWLRQADPLSIAEMSELHFSLVILPAFNRPTGSRSRSGAAPPSRRVAPRPGARAARRGS